MKIKDFFVKTKIALDRGRNWLAYLSFLMIVFVTVSSMTKYPIFSMFNGPEWIVVILISTLIGVTIIGYFDIVSGVYGKEAEIVARINPVQSKLLKNQEDIIKRIENLERKLK